MVDIADDEKLIDGPVKEKQLKKTSKQRKSVAENVRALTDKHYKQEMEKNLVEKASHALGWMLFLLVAVYITYLVANGGTQGSTEITSEIMRTLGTSITFILGFLFGTGKGK